MAKLALHALDHLFHNQNKNYACLRLLANYKAGSGDSLDIPGIPGADKVVFGDYCEVLLFHQVRFE